MPEWLQYGALGLLAMVLVGVGFFLKMVFSTFAGFLTRVEDRLYASLNKLDDSSSRLAQSFENHETLDARRFAELQESIGEVHKDVLRGQNNSHQIKAVGE